MHEQAAPTRGVAVDHVDAAQREARAVGHLDGARQALGVEGRALGAHALERQVAAAQHARRACYEHIAYLSY